MASRDGTSAEQALADNAARASVEHLRYQTLYGIDLSDQSIYDLVLDSSTDAPEVLALGIVHRARTTFP